MADVETTTPEGDAPATEEPTAPQVVRRSSIGDMVKDLENAYEEAQEEVALLSEQVKTMVHMSEFIDFGKLKDAINTLESEKAELQREKDWAIAKADTAVLDDDISGGTPPLQCGLDGSPRPRLFCVLRLARGLSTYTTTRWDCLCFCFCLTRTFVFLFVVFFFGIY